MNLKEKVTKIYYPGKNLQLSSKMQYKLFKEAKVDNYSKVKVDYAV